MSSSQSSYEGLQTLSQMSNEQKQEVSKRISTIKLSEDSENHEMSYLRPHNSTHKHLKFDSISSQSQHMLLASNA